MPSAKILEEKKVKVVALTETLQKSTSGVLVDYKGISVEDDTKLRKELREAGITYSVEKNKILAFALKNVGLDGLCDVLSGTTALALSDGDQTAAARILGKYAEKYNGEKFILKAGFIDKEVYDAKGVTALSKIPSKEVLLAQLLGSLNGPIQGLAAILKAVHDKKEQEAA